MRISKYIILLITLIQFNSCVLFKKEISKPITICFIDTIISPRLSSSGITTKYIGMVSSEEISAGFLKNFISEGDNTTNVTLVKSEQNADFTLKFISLDISETSKTEKINDSKSPHNGQDVVLNTVECSASFKVIKNSDKKKDLMSCNNIKSRTEKLKNNRDLGDLLFGTNKNKTEYRTKLLSDRICLNLAEDVGRRIWVPITRRIAKNLK